jgi:hypothetical protein
VSLLPRPFLDPFPLNRTSCHRMNKGPFWIPPTLYGGCDRTIVPPWGRPPLWKLCPAGRFIYFSFLPLFLESQTFLAVLEPVSSNLMSEVEVVALYKKVSPRPCDYTVTKSDEE